jgi:hypothetical protein
MGCLDRFMTDLRDTLRMAISALLLAFSVQAEAATHSGTPSPQGHIDSSTQSSKTKNSGTTCACIEVVVPDARVGKVCLLTPLAAAKSRIKQLLDSPREPVPAGTRSVKIVPGGGLYLYASCETADDTRPILNFNPEHFIGLEFSPFGVTDDQIKNVTHLTALEILDLRNSDLTDAGLSSVGQLKNLMVLNCNSTLINGSGLQHLTGLTKLSSLTLAKNRLSDNVLSVLPSLSQLQTLNLRRCNLSDACLDYLAKLPHLEQLDISDNRGITSKGIARLHTMDSLQVLRVMNTMVRPHDVAVFKQFKSLKILEIGGLDFDSATINAWQKELPHTAVALASTQSKIQKEMPVEVFRPLH